jgi:hypothetical protein
MYIYNLRLLAFGSPRGIPRSAKLSASGWFTELEEELVEQVCFQVPLMVNIFIMLSL